MSQLSGTGSPAATVTVSTSTPRHRMRWASTDFGTVHDAVGRSVTSLDGAWEGASADNFVAYMGTYKNAGDSLKSALTNAAADLKGASQGLSGAKTALENNFSKLHSEISSYLNELARRVWL